MFNAYVYIYYNGIVKEEDYLEYTERQGVCVDTSDKQKTKITYAYEKSRLSNYRLKQLVA